MRPVSKSDVCLDMSACENRNSFQADSANLGSSGLLDLDGLHLEQFTSTIHFVHVVVLLFPDSRGHGSVPLLLLLYFAGMLLPKLAAELHLVPDTLAHQQACLLRPRACQLPKYNQSYSLEVAGLSRGNPLRLPDCRKMDATIPKPTNQKSMVNGQWSTVDSDMLVQCGMGKSHTALQLYGIYHYQRSAEAHGIYIDHTR